MLLASSFSHAFFCDTCCKGGILNSWGFCVSVFLVLCFWFCVSVFLCFCFSGFYLAQFWFLLPDVLAIFIAKTPRKQLVCSLCGLFTLDDPKMYQRFCARGLILKTYHQHR